jgi:hypothetical protein
LQAAIYNTVKILVSGNLKLKIYKNIIVLVALYGCETWSLTLREEHRVNVFENRVVRRICEPKRDENAGEWRKLHKEELNKLSSFSNIIRQFKARRMRWTGHVARMGEERKVYRLLVGKPEVKSHSEEQDVDGRMGLEWVLGRLDG